MARDLKAVEQAAITATSGAPAGIDLGDPDGSAMRALTAIAERIGLRATISTVDEPAGPFLEFLLAVYAAWGEPRTPAAIKAAFYRSRS